MADLNNYFCDSLITNTIPLKKVSLTKKVQLFLFDSNGIALEMFDALADKYLHESEQKILLQRKRQLAKQEFIISRLLIKLLASLQRHTALHNIETRFNQQKLLLEVYVLNVLQPISVCLSHSRGLIFIALSTECDISLGVDIEMINLKKEVDLLAQHFFHSDEIKQITKDGENAFYRIWTLKEAFSKFRKQAIATTLKQNIFEQLPTLAYHSGHYKNFDLSFISKKSPQPTQEKIINIFETTDFLNSITELSIADGKI